MSRSRIRSRSRSCGVSSLPWYTLGKADDTDPSFWADFANDRYAVNGAEEAFSDIFTFTRSTTGTYFDANGVMQIAAINTPRFDHDPLTGEKLGLLIEEQRTNIIPYSQNLTAADGWSVGGNLTQNGQTGTLFGVPAYSFTSVSAVSSYIRKSISVTAGNTYTFWFYTTLGSMPSGNATWDDDIVNNAGYSSAGSVIIEEVATGVYRWSQTFVASGTSINVHAGPIDRDAGTTWLVTACQCEDGSYPTSYIPTTSAVVTRTADSLTSSSANVMPFGSWYSALIGGTAFVSSNTLSNGSIFIGDTPSGEKWEIRNDSSTTIQNVVDHSSANTGFASQSGLTSYGQRKIAATNITNSFALVIDGISAVTDTSGSIAEITSISFMKSITGHIKEFRYYNFRVTDYELQRITSSRDSYIGAVATRTAISSNHNSSLKYCNSRSWHFARDNISSLGIVLGTYIGINEGPKWDTTFTASVEYPANNFTQITWDGETSKLILAGNQAASDIVTLDTPIPEGEKFWIRIFQNAPSGIIFSNQKYTTFGDALEYSASPLPDRTLTSGTWSNMTGGYPYLPLAIIAPTTKPTFLLFGDSKVVANSGGVSTDLLNGDATGDIGELARSIGEKYGYMNVGISGDKAQNVTTLSNMDNRYDLAQYCSHVILNYGVNDIIGGRTSTQIKSDLLTLYDRFKSIDKKVHQTTVTPRTSSTDGWTTVINQTASTNFALGATGTRYELNSWIRDNTASIDGNFDVATVVENAQDDGRWKAGYTGDGLHENSTGYIAIRDSNIISEFGFWG